MYTAPRIGAVMTAGMTGRMLLACAGSAGTAWYPAFLLMMSAVATTPMMRPTPVPMMSMTHQFLMNQVISSQVGGGVVV